MTALPFTRTRVTWLNYLMISYYGFLLNSLGPITPFLQSELDINYTVSSYHFSAFAVGMVLAGVFGDRISMRVGRQRLFWAGGVAAAVGSFLLIIGQIPFVTIGGTLMIGFGGSLTFLLIPSTLAMYYPNHQLKAITEANVIASLISITAPLLIGTFENLGWSWRVGFYVAILGFVMLFLTSRNIMLPAAAVKTSTHSSERTPVIFWWMWLRVFLAVSIEFCVLFWGANFLEKERGFVNGDAVALMSLVLFGMFVGRGIGSWLSDKMAPGLLFILSLGFVSGGFLIYAFIQSLAAVGLTLTGLGIANLYPIAFDQTLRSVPIHQDTASARLAMASGSAILVMPLVLGWVADRTGIGPAFLASIIGLIVATFVLHFMLLSRSGKQL